MPREIRTVDPRDQAEWDRLALARPDYSFFHSSAWARALTASYGFKPLYLIARDGGRPTLIMPLMEVASRLTGRRGVSLPFTDLCGVMADDEDLFGRAVQEALRLGRDRGWGYVEWRDAGHFEERLPASELFYVHEVGLAGGGEAIFRSLSDANRRSIRKAQREGVVVRVGASPALIEEFYRLNLITRKRHGLPPQPLAFFRNVHEHILSRDQGIVVSASHRDRVIAASVFLNYGLKAVYKYGASDLAFQHLRPNNLVMWEALTWYAERGYETMSLGRTEMDNPGLRQFKKTWGGAERLVKYHRFDLREKSFVGLRSPASARFESLFSRMPTSLLKLVGRALYKHAA